MFLRLSFSTVSILSSVSNIKVLFERLDSMCDLLSVGNSTNSLGNCVF